MNASESMNTKFTKFAITYPKNKKKNVCQLLMSVTFVRNVLMKCRYSVWQHTLFLHIYIQLLLCKMYCKTNKHANWQSSVMIYYCKIKYKSLPSV